MTGRRNATSRPRYALLVPGDWVRHELVGPDDRAAAEAAFVARLRRDRQDGPVPPDVMALLHSTLAAARDAGALELFLYSRTIGERLAVASLTVSAVPAETSQDLEDLGMLALRFRADEGDDGVDRPPLVSIVPTLAGEAVRVERTRTLDVGEGECLRAHEVQYARPVPGTELILLLTFSTPNVAAADAFTTVFDVIAESLRFDPPRRGPGRPPT